MIGAWLLYAYGIYVAGVVTVFSYEFYQDYKNITKSWDEKENGHIEMTKMS